MSNVYESFDYKGFTVKIEYDTDPEDTRKEWDNLGTIYTAHRRIQPEEDFNKHFEIEQVFKNGILGDFNPSFLKEYVALPIYIYSHSGVTVKTTPYSCRWDSGFFGIIAVPVSKVLKDNNWGKLSKKRRSRIEDYLCSEVSILDNTYTGEVYWFSITNNETGEELHSCGGYYGEDGLKDIRQECKSSIDHHLLDIMKSNLIKFGRQLWIPFAEFPELATL